MDKLKPVLAHKFWILFGLALLLPLIGWWMDTGALAKQIEERWTKLEGTKAPATATAPNDRWIEAVARVNQVQDQRLKMSAAQLWEAQQRLMTWPDEITDLMESVPYQGEPPKVAPDLYRTAYYTELDEILQIVEPYDMRAGTGKVIAHRGVIPHVKEGTWQAFPPKTDEMWNAQEDLWLVRSILAAVARTNEGSTSIGDATVKAISSLNLMGGSRSAGGAAGGAVAGGYGAAGEGYAGGDAGYTEGYAAEMGEMMGQMMGGATGEQGVAGQPKSVDFDPTKEFGPPDRTAAPAASAGGEAYGAGGESYDAGSSYGGGEAYSGMPGGMGPMGAMGAMGASSFDRYIDDGEGIPYKTRGFYLKVVMDHRKLPEFLAELASMEWPTQIVRVHQASMEVPSSGGMGGPSSMGGSGSPMASSGYPGAGGGMMGGGLGSSMPTPMMTSPSMNIPMLGGRSYGGSYGGEADSGYGMGMGMGMSSSGYPMMGQQGTTPQDPEEMRAMQQKMRLAQEQYRIAMTDPYLANVVVAGLMTIYNPPTELLPAEAPVETEVPVESAVPQTEEPAAEVVPGTETVVPPVEGTAPGVEQPAAPPTEPLPGTEGILPPVAPAEPGQSGLAPPNATTPQPEGADAPGGDGSGAAPQPDSPDAAAVPPGT